MILKTSLGKSSSVKLIALSHYATISLRVAVPVGDFWSLESFIMTQVHDPLKQFTSCRSWFKHACITLQFFVAVLVTLITMKCPFLLRYINVAGKPWAKFYVETFICAPGNLVVKDTSLATTCYTCRCLNILMKHSFSCLIYYVKP